MKILAITSDASLEVALSSLPGEWELIPARDPNVALQAACHAEVALVALGTTERGLQAVDALHRLGVGLPVLVVGDVQTPDDTQVHVLTRPFSMGDLVDAIRRTTTEQVAVAAPPPAPAEPDPIPEPMVYEPEPEPEPPAEDPDSWALTLLQELGQAADAVESGRPIPQFPARTLPAAFAPEHEATAARLVRHAAAGPSGDAWGSSEPRAGRGLHRLRKRKRNVALPAGSRASTIRRVRSALDGARDLVALLGEMPALGDPRSIATAMVREAVELLGAQTCLVYAPGGAGPYEILASHGLSPAEQATRVPKDQPLLADVAARLEAVLVAPVDLVRGLVSGIAGTATEALMLAPLDVDNVCHGLLVAGRGSFDEQDLERFWLLAEEAAPGFAASLLLQRLRHPDLPLAL